MHETGFNIENEPKMNNLLNDTTAYKRINEILRQKYKMMWIYWFWNDLAEGKSTFPIQPILPIVMLTIRKVISSAIANFFMKKLDNKDIN